VLRHLILMLLMALSLLGYMATGVHGAASRQPFSSRVHVARTVDGLRIALNRVSLPARAPSARGPLLPARGRRWLRTAWSFRNLSRRAIRIHAPTAAHYRFVGHAFSVSGRRPNYLLRPQASRRYVWYFEIPRSARKIWLTYNTGTRAVSYHVVFR
jgi:hypothetical protein